MSSSIFWIIIGMAVVTYIPRMLPFVVLNGKRLPPRIEGALRNVPFAALGALIFPGILFVQDSLFFGIVGAASAIILSYVNENMVFIVLGSICILSLLLPIF
ncbi:AzlD domain-containing protein [Sinobaca sp. H24]|uniref:AzlD domain-containing protein n=1 Tax=Sinobaca sp. H24 TaxID=2923376 RepID=UPI00207A86E6|nr:AzlD domain-containing protein [Sinobaca sp. H24]